MFAMLQFNVGGIPHTKHFIGVSRPTQGIVWPIQECHCYKSCNVDFWYATIQCWWYSSHQAVDFIGVKDQHMALCYEYKNAIVAKGWCLLCYNSMLVVFLILSSWFHWSIKTNTRHYVVNIRISSLQEVDVG